MQLRESPHSTDHKPLSYWLVTWNTTKETIKEGKKERLPSTSKTYQVRLQERIQ
jgi:hypothetical protein